MENDLQRLREAIDETDDQLLTILAERAALSKQIATVKADTGMAILDSQREFDILNRLAQKADALGIPRTFVNQIFKLIMEQSRQIQAAIRSAKE